MIIFSRRRFPVRSVKARAGRYPRLDIAEGKLMRRDLRAMAAAE